MNQAKHEFSKIAEELIAEFRGVPNDEPLKMRRRPTRNLSELIEEISQKYSLGRSTPEDAIKEQWKSIVGPALASSSHPVRIDRGRRLLVLVSDSVVREEIFFQRATIVERIQTIPGCSTVTELYIRSG